MHSPCLGLCDMAPAALMNWPAGQSLYGLHAVAFLSVLNEPAAQPLHARSTSPVPVPVMYWPVPQAVHATHGLAGLSS